MKKETVDERTLRIARLKMATKIARAVLKEGDRIGSIRCMGRKQVFTFAGWDGDWIVSKSGVADIHSANIYSLNGYPITFKGELTNEIL